MSELCKRTRFCLTFGNTKVPTFARATRDASRDPRPSHPSPSLNEHPSVLQVHRHAQHDPGGVTAVVRALVSSYALAIEETLIQFALAETVSPSGTDSVRPDIYKVLTFKIYNEIL